MHGISPHSSAASGLAVTDLFPEPEQVTTALYRPTHQYGLNRGIKEIFGDVLQKNRAKLKMCKILGFARSRVPDDPGVTRVTLKL